VLLFANILLLMSTIA